MSKAMEITKDNYHTPENTALSCTKIKDFLKSKELYYRRYMEATEPPLESPSIKTGRIIDKILEQMTLHHFKRSYTRAVLKRDDTQEFERQKKMDKEKVLAPANYDAIIGIAEKALRAPFLDFYRDRKNKTEKQKVCVQDYHISGEYVNKTDMEQRGIIPICGMLDRFTISGMTGYIDDYKTSAASGVRSAQGWAYVCDKFGYFMQLAVYKWLVQQQYPEIENIVCRHVIFGTSKFDMYPIKLFIIPDELLEEPLKLFFDTVDAIKQEQDWTDKLPDWDDAEELPVELSQEPPDMVDEEEMNSL